MNKREFGDVKEMLELAVNSDAVRWVVYSTATFGSTEKAMYWEYSLPFFDADVVEQLASFEKAVYGYLD